jgi:hypothetical protein
VSTYQLAHARDLDHSLVVEWCKYPPHYRVVTDDSRSRGYHTEDAAMRAAKRLCRKLGLTLQQEDYDNANQY